MLARLETIIEERERERPEGSYTTYLFAQGVDKILKKVGEETAETIIAAKNGDNAELRSESADLIFHLMVLWRARGLDADEVWGELERRFGRAPRAGATEGRPSRASEGSYRQYQVPSSKSQVNGEVAGARYLAPGTCHLVLPFNPPGPSHARQRHLAVVRLRLPARVARGGPPRRRCRAAVASSIGSRAAARKGGVQDHLRLAGVAQPPASGSSQSTCDPAGR